MILAPYESYRTVDIQDISFLDPGRNSVFEYDEIPKSLSASASLLAGEPVIASRLGRVIFAGTTRDRPGGFLPTMLTVKRIEHLDIEEVTVEIPLHHFYLPKDELYQARIVGGHGSRYWVELGSFTQSVDGVVDDNLNQTYVSTDVSKHSDPDITQEFDDVVRLLSSIVPDKHTAMGPIGIINHNIEELN